MVDVTAVNPHRWEISKLVGTPFTITRKIATNKTVANVYALEGNKLTKLSWKQPNAGEVSFTLNSLSLHPYVIEYGPDKKSIATATISGVVNKTYTGKALTQTPVVKLGSTTLKAGTDYTVSYKNNVQVGTATITFTGKGNYMGTATKTFKITKPANTTKPDVPVYWIVNKKSGENLYTTAWPEVNKLCNQKKTWTNKGIMWYAPATGKPVYRLVNKKTNDHHFTMNQTEIKQLTQVKKTWKMDFSGKPVFYSGGSKSIWRLRSDSRIAAKKAGTHMFALSQASVNALKKKGWTSEGVLLYAKRYK